MIDFLCDIECAFYHKKIIVIGLVFRGKNICVPFLFYMQRFGRDSCLELILFVLPSNVENSSCYYSDVIVKFIKFILIFRI